MQPTVGWDALKILLEKSDFMPSALFYGLDGSMYSNRLGLNIFQFMWHWFKLRGPIPFSAKLENLIFSFFCSFCKIYQCKTIVCAIYWYELIKCVLVSKYLSKICHFLHIWGVKYCVIMRHFRRKSGQLKT